MKQFILRLLWPLPRFLRALADGIEAGIIVAAGEAGAETARRFAAEQAAWKRFGGWLPRPPETRYANLVVLSGPGGKPVRGLRCGNIRLSAEAARRINDAVKQAQEDARHPLPPDIRLPGMRDRG